jgi:mannose-6-phosphate isomerase-like protein (cupin superfamily)
MSLSQRLPPGVILVPRGEGRQYECGPMRAVFLADGAESEHRYSVSIWWVAPDSSGPGAHCHEANEELFYVVEGTITFLVGDERLDAPAGSFLRVPARMMHDFENNTKRPAGVFNVFIPGGFESNMPAIVEWYRAKRQTEPVDSERLP